ncbi:LexA family protein [Vreelandella aquamarina]|uniref:LexA family protein n=1 Tax=Vreelandella aquamarina TaxID=77097 RepID=UPI00078196D4|nr:S24 family peptidase [Halomonas axialensis]
MSDAYAKPELSSRLKYIRKKIGLNQAQLAELSGVSQRQISAYERGKSEPRLDTLEKLAAALSTTAEWLEFGDDESDIDILTEESMKSSLTAPHVPILTWAGLGDPVQRNAMLYQDYIAIPEIASDEAFALRIMGESMAPEYPPGCLIVVDPNVEATNGSDVIVAVEDGVSFKRLVIEPGGETFLRPLNPQFPVTQVKKSDYRVLGVVVLQLIYRNQHL